MNPARNASRFNNRIPVVARIPTLPTPQNQNTSDMPVFASRPNPSPNIRRIFSDNHNRQAQHPRIDPEETSFEQYFSELFTKCVFSLVKTLIVCLILMILTQIMDTTTTLSIGACILVSANVIHGIYFLTVIRFEKPIQEKLRLFLRGLQCVPLIIFVLSVGIIHNKTMNNVSAALYIVLYAIITGVDFLAPGFIHVYITKIKKVVLLMKILVILQLILIVIQRNLSNPITWFAAFFPLYILVLVLLICTIVLIKKAFITHRAQFWITEAYHKKEAIAWILANLVGLQVILLYGTIHASFILNDDPSNYTGPFLPLCIIINLSCLASLFFVWRVHEGIPKVFKTLASLPATVANHVPHELYVIKISSTYFKMAMKRDINQLKSQKESAKSGDSEGEAGLKRMATEMGMCMICYKGVSDGVFMWCGHGGICFECGKEILKVKNECHMCREKIWSVLKVEINAKEVYFKVLEEIKCESF